MISNPRFHLERMVSKLANELAAGVNEATGMDQAVQPATLDEVAKAIEFFLKEQGDGSFIDSGGLNVLASQALLSVGECHAARSLVLFGSGMLRPASWEISGERDMWILDLREMTVRSDGVMEMVFFNGLALVLDAIADIWDVTRGDGVLGLRNVCVTAEALLGGGRKQATRGLVAEILDLCNSKLDRIRTDREWTTFPEVINLDL